MCIRIYEEKWRIDTIRDLEKENKVMFKFSVNLHILYITVTTNVAQQSSIDLSLVTVA